MQSSNLIARESNRSAANRSSFRLLAVIAVLLASMAGALGVNRAGAIPPTQEASPVAASILPPDAMVDGHTLAEWQVRYWQWFMTTVSGEGPDNTILDATGAACAIGQHGPVFFLQNSLVSKERACTVPSDAILFVPLLVTQCTSTQVDPELPPDPETADDATLMACAKTHINVGLDHDLPSTTLTVDGVPVDFSAYRTATPVFLQVVTAGNFFDIKPGVGRAAGNGYAVLLRPLSEGEHLLEMSWAYGPGDYSYRLTVSSDPMAT